MDDVPYLWSRTVVTEVPHPRLQAHRAREARRRISGLTPAHRGGERALHPLRILEAHEPARDVGGAVEGDEGRLGDAAEAGHEVGEMRVAPSRGYRRHEQRETLRGALRTFRRRAEEYVAREG